MLWNMWSRLNYKRISRLKKAICNSAKMHVLGIVQDWTGQDAQVTFDSSFQVGMVQIAETFQNI